LSWSLPEWNRNFLKPKQLLDAMNLVFGTARYALLQHPRLLGRLVFEAPIGAQGLPWLIDPWKILIGQKSYHLH
jgi:hypothetical protein